MGGEECGTRAVIVPFNARARSEHCDAAVGERICRAALGHHQRRARIPLQVLGVLGEFADEEDLGLRCQRRRSRMNRRDSPAAQGQGCRGSRSRSERPMFARAPRALALGHLRRTAAPARRLSTWRVHLRSWISLRGRTSRRIAVVLSNSAGGLYFARRSARRSRATSLDYRRNRSPNVSEHHRTYCHPCRTAARCPPSA